MKNLKKLLILVTFSFSILIFDSCNKEDLHDHNDIAQDHNDNWDDDSNDDVSGDDDNTAGNDDSGQEEGSITLYKVEGEHIIKVQDYDVTGQNLAYQKDTQKHQDIWNLVKKVVPMSFRSKMSQFLIYNGEQNGSAGFVFPTSTDLSKWQMAIAIDYPDTDDLIHTVIHEFGHILTLSNKQVNASIMANSCSNYHTGEGCANADSYINKSYQKFWADIWGDFQKGQDSETAAEEFYNKYQNRFVTQYASTNPGEDIAEVFAYFVMRSNSAEGNTIADKKMQLLYDYNETVELRNYARKNISFSSKSRKNGAYEMWKPRSFKTTHKSCVRGLH